MGISLPNQPGEVIQERRDLLGIKMIIGLAMKIVMFCVVETGDFILLVAILLIVFVVK